MMPAPKKMIVKTAMVLGAVLVAYCVNCPIVLSLDDPWRAFLVQSLTKLTWLSGDIQEMLGLGSYIGNMASFSATETIDGPPFSSSFGDLNVTRTTMDGVPVIIYSPWDRQELMPGMVFIHGGGWAISTAEMWDYTAYTRAKCTNTILINVDYRLSFSDPFPAALEDCAAVVKHVLMFGHEYGIDVNRVGLDGESSGGNMAAGIATQLKNANASSLPSLKFMAMIYPPLQVINFRLPSYVDLFDSVPSLTTELMATFYLHYMGVEKTKIRQYAKIMIENRHVSPQFLETYGQYTAPTKLPKGHQTSSQPAPAVTEPHDEELFQILRPFLTNPLVSPLIAPDLSGLPPTIVIVHKNDVLKSDGLLFYQRLLDSGVPTELYINNGFHLDQLMLNGYPDWLISATGKNTTREVCKFVSKVIQTIS